MTDPQTRYFQSEELALENTLKELKSMLENANPKKAFIRTFDLGFSLGFMAAIVMDSQGFDIAQVDTGQTQLDVS